MADSAGIRLCYQAGLSLIELMISMMLGLVLMAGLTQVFTSSQQTLSLSQSFGEIQESGRQGAMLLARDIRNADYWGCMNEATMVKSNLNAPVSGSLLGFENGIEVYPDADAGNSVPDGSHTIVVRGLNGASAIQVHKLPAANAASLHLTDASGVKLGDVLVVSDCKDANIFQVSADPNNSNIVVHNTGDSVTPGNAIKEMPKRYEGNARVYRPEVTRYSVREDADGRFALVYEKLILSDNGGTATGLGDPVEVVAGVIDMRAQLGVDDDLDGSIDRWIDPPAQGAAGAVDTLANTLALRISLLVRSGRDTVVSEPVSYCFPGWLSCTSDATGLQTADDRSFYKSYTFTASIRNRIVEETP